MPIKIVEISKEIDIFSVGMEFSVLIQLTVMSSLLLLQQYPACLLRLILMVCEMGGKYPYSSCFVGYTLIQLLFRRSLIESLILTASSHNSGFLLQTRKA